LIFQWKALPELTSKKRLLRTLKANLPAKSRVPAFAVKNPDLFRQFARAIARRRIFDFNFQKVLLL